MSLKLSAETLKYNLTNPARTYMWDIIFPRVVGGGDNNALTIRAQSTAIPGRSIGTILLPYKATAGVIYPGKNTYDHEWSVTFLEGEDKKIHNAIYTWMNYAVDDIYGFGAGDLVVKSDIYLRLLSTRSGSEHAVFRMVGAFPTNIAKAELDNASEDVVRYSVTFGYDRWVDAT